MASIYFNSEIVGHNVPYTERFRGLCFRPLHYFFEGKTRTWTGGCFRETQDSYPAAQKTWPTSLKMVVLIVPALIVGTIAAVVAMVEWYFSGTLPSLRSALTEEAEVAPVYTKADAADPFVAPTYELRADFSPNKSHEALHGRWFAFISKLTSADSWKDPAIRSEFGEILEEAYKEMNLIFQHAAKAAGNDPARMAELMIAQHVYSDRDGENYCRAFFYGSIGPIFNAVRTRKYFEKADGGGLSQVRNWDHHRDALSWKNAKAFFTSGTPEYRWRRLYNDACALMDRYPGLREALKKGDDRFLKCAIPDFSPSSGSSSWSDVPTC
jgi:hypothetical protein